MMMCHSWLIARRARRFICRAQRVLPLGSLVCSTSRGSAGAALRTLLQTPTATDAAQACFRAQSARLRRRRQRRCVVRAAPITHARSRATAGVYGGARRVRQPAFSDCSNNNALTSGPYYLQTPSGSVTPAALATTRLQRAAARAAHVMRCGRMGSRSAFYGTARFAAKNANAVSAAPDVTRRTKVFKAKECGNGPYV